MSNSSSFAARRVLYPNANATRTADADLIIRQQPNLQTPIPPFPPHLPLSSPSPHSLSTYPNFSLTSLTTPSSPVFFPTLSLILIAGWPFAEESLMTMLRGGDFEVVDGEVWVKSSVGGGG